MRPASRAQPARLARLCSAPHARHCCCSSEDCTCRASRRVSGHVEVPSMEADDKRSAGAGGCRRGHHPVPVDHRVAPLRRATARAARQPAAIASGAAAYAAPRRSAPRPAHRGGVAEDVERRERRVFEEVKSARRPRPGRVGPADAQGAARILDGMARAATRSSPSVQRPGRCYHKLWQDVATMTTISPMSGRFGPQDQLPRHDERFGEDGARHLRLSLLSRPRRCIWCRQLGIRRQPG